MVDTLDIKYSMKDIMKDMVSHIFKVFGGERLQKRKINIASIIEKFL